MKNQFFAKLYRWYFIIILFFSRKNRAHLQLYGFLKKNHLLDSVKTDIVSYGEKKIGRVCKVGVSHTNRTGLYGKSSGVHLGQLNFVKAVSEALERISYVSYFPTSAFVQMTLVEARKKKCLPVTDMCGYLNNLSEDIKLTWVLSKEVTHQTDAYVPVQFLSGAYLEKAVFIERSEPLITATNSSGCAAHLSSLEASVRALLELIERDAFLVYWHSSLKPYSIDLDSIEDIKIKKILTTIKKLNVSVFVLYLPTDIAAYVFCVILQDKKRGTLSVETIAGVDAPDKLIFETIEQALIGLGLNQQAALHTQDQYDLHQMRIKSLSDNKFRNDVMQFIHNAVDLRIDDLQVHTVRGCRWQYLLNLFKHLNYEVYMKEITLPLLSHLKPRLYVSRVVCPALIPLYLNENFSTNYQNRIKKVATFLKQEGSKTQHRSHHPLI